jgi:hypothetical protein
LLIHGANLADYHPPKEMTAGCVEMLFGVCGKRYSFLRVPGLVMMVILLWLKIRVERRINYVPLQR